MTHACLSHHHEMQHSCCICISKCKCR